jgi:hypothetical protein
MIYDDNNDGDIVDLYICIGMIIMMVILWIYIYVYVWYMMDNNWW